MDQPKMSVSEGEVLLRRLAEKRRSEHGEQGSAKLAKVEAGLSAFEKLLAATAASIETKVQTVDASGEIRLQTFPGINGGGIDSKNALVTSNVRSRRERSQHIRGAIAKVEKVIAVLKPVIMDRGGFRPDEIADLIRKGEVPSDIDAFLSDLESSIPPANDVWEVISAPQF